MTTERLFLFFPFDMVTGEVLYKDPVSGITQRSLLKNLTTYDASCAPDGWQKAVLSFARNEKYYGVNRSYTDPLMWVKNHATIIRELYYGGLGIETKLGVAIFKYNGSPATPASPNYDLYYLAPLDFPNIVDIPDTGVQCNMMEGGILQLLKTYENMDFEFPCDGSIPENVQVNVDGMYYPGSLNYNFVKNSTPGGYEQPGYPSIFPTSYIGNTGDSFGIVQADQNFFYNVPDSYFAAGNNSLFYSASPITVTIAGTVNIGLDNAHFTMALITSAGQKITFAPQLVTVNGNGQDTSITIKFSQSVSLQANERLYLCFYPYFYAEEYRWDYNIKSGSFSITFGSAYPATRPWGISAWDLWKLIVRRIFDASNVSGLPFNYQADSQLLQQYLGLILTSGDALRASGDPNYQKFFQQFQINAGIPSNNIITAYGPVLKTSLYKFFQFCNTVLFAALGNQKLTGEPESLFMETMSYVLNKDGNQITVGEVAKMKATFPQQLMFTEIEIGYPNQTYDQKAGKYEWNTTALWYTPFVSMPSKKLSLICPYRADVYGIESLRSNIDQVSTTRNTGDNDVFILNCDTNKKSFAYQTNSFTSLIREINNGNNTNQRFSANTLYQPIYTNVTDGSFFSVNNDPSIFVFSYPGLNNVMTLNFAYTGFIVGELFNASTGVAADEFNITLFINGEERYSREWDSTSPQTNFTHTFSTTQAFKQGDCIYIQVGSTSSSTISTISLQMEVGSTLYWQANDSNIPVEPGTLVKNVAITNIDAPLISGHPVLAISFEYYLFNSVLQNSSFIGKMSIDYQMSGTAGQTTTYYLYKNGVVISQATQASLGNITAGTLNFPGITTEDFNLGDVVFIAVSVQNINSQMARLNLTWTSQTIAVFGLKRVQYDYISGIPLLTANGRTDVAGAPYNIEDLTPRRLLEMWKSWLASLFYNQPNGAVQFSTSGKNQFLITTYKGKTYKESQPAFHVGEMGAPLFLPIQFEYDTEVPNNFSSLMSGAANSHVNFTYNGVQFGGFTWSLSQSPALNEKQGWTVMASPKTDPEDLIMLNFDGLNFLDMINPSIRSSFVNSMKFVPKNQTLDPRYHTLDMDSTLFIDQVSGWLNTRGYCNPWMIGEKIALQFIVNGLSPVTAQLYDCSGNQVGSEIEFAQKTSNAIQTIYSLWEGTLDLTTIVAGTYNLVVNAGGIGGSFIVSEPINVQEDQIRTLLFEYKNSVNRQSAIFDTGWIGSFRVRGFMDNKLQPEYTGQFYEDQGNNISILGSIPYETRDLWIGMDDGVPDYVIKLISRIMLFDTVMIDGVYYSLDDGAKWAQTFIKGNPKKFWKIKIRPSKNADGIVVGTTGIEDANMMITLDGNSIGPNAGGVSDSDNPLITGLELTS